MPFWLKLTVANTSGCSPVSMNPYTARWCADSDAVFRVKNNSGVVRNADEVDIRTKSGDLFLKYRDTAMRNILIFYVQITVGTFTGRYMFL